MGISLDPLDWTEVTQEFPKSHLEEGLAAIGTPRLVGGEQATLDMAARRQCLEQRHARRIIILHHVQVGEAGLARARPAAAGDGPVPEAPQLQERTVISLVWFWSVASPLIPSSFKKKSTAMLLSFQFTRLDGQMIEVVPRQEPRSEWSGTNGYDLGLGSSATSLRETVSSSSMK